MRILPPWYLAAGATAAVAFLTSCSSSGTVPTPVTAGNSGQNPAIGRSYGPKGSLTSSPISIVYISDAIANTVTSFNSDGTLKKTITRFISAPSGLFVDRKHNLWVANSGKANVLEFAAGATKPEKTLTDPGVEPSDVTVCRDGTVFVAGESPSIAVYAHGSTTPTRYLKYPHTNATFFTLTCDAAGNIFSIADADYRLNLLAFPRGYGIGATIIAVPGTPYGLRTDATGTKLLITDQPNATITEYTEAGKSTGHTIHTTEGASCINFAVASDGTIGCPVYYAHTQTTTVGATFSFPRGKLEQTYVDPLYFAQPNGFAFDEIPAK